MTPQEPVRADQQAAFEPITGTNGGNTARIIELQAYEKAATAER